MAEHERFLPSRHGFAFTNSWPAQAALLLPTPVGRIGVGNAARGLCGGMVFAALDYWNSGTVPPAARPAPGEALYRHIVRRIVASWRIPVGIARYYVWMLRPDRDGASGPVRAALSMGGAAERAMRTEWPEIAARLDRGIPVPLGVVTVASASLAQLPRNHQVLAYGYRAARGRVTVHVYDPNRGPRDDVAIRCDPDAPPGAAVFSHDLGIRRPVRGFFRTPYTPVPPP